MTTEAEEFKKINKLNYSSMSNIELLNLPSLFGICNFATNFFKIKLICINN